MTAKLHPESSILAPRDPSITDDNEWPIFRLTDAAVYSSDTLESANLLDACQQTPVIVRGKLRLAPDEGEEEADYDDLRKALLRRPRQRTIGIEIENVRSFSYGDSPELWAAGAAGWFTIAPSDSYHSRYDEMIEAVNIFYFIADAYKTPRKKGRGKNATTLPDYSAEEFFDKYAAEVMDGGERQAAKDKIYQHRDFLLSEMVAGKQDIAWSKNPLFSHLRKKFPKDYARLRQKIVEAAQKYAQDSGLAPAHLRLPSVDSASTTSSKKGRGRPRKNGPTDVISIGSSSVASCTAKEGSEKGTKSKTQPPNQPQRKTTRNLRASGSAPETPEVQESQQAETSAQDSDEALPRPPKSGLRLKPNKPIKGPPKSRQTRSAEDEEEEEPASRSSPIPHGKRKRDDPSTTAGTRRGPKRRHSRHEVDEGIDMPSSPSNRTTSEDDDEEEEIVETPTSDDATAGAASANLPLRFTDHPDPLQEDTWTCALDGCTHKIYSASLPESQKLIREHYALHAFDDDDRVRLVKGLQAPSMPVSHLMEKVKMQAKLEGFPGSRVAGTRYPEPLKQKF